MRYYRKNGREFVANGESLLQVSTLRQVRSPRADDRVIKVMVIQRVKHQSPTNLIQPGALLGLSFPEQRINAKDYVWGQHGQEECQVDFKLKLYETDYVEGDPLPAPPE